MEHKLSTASTIEVGDWLIADGTLVRVTSIMDTPATDIEGASRFIRHTGGILAVYASETILAQA